MKTLLIGAALAALLVSPAPSAAKRHSLVFTYGQDVLVAKNGTVSVRAQCLANQAGLDVLRVYAATTAPAVARGWSVYYPGDGSYLMPATEPTAATLGQATQSTGDEFFAVGFDSGAVMDVATQVGLAVRAETMLMGVNSGGDDCLLSVDIIPFKKFKEAK